MSRAVKIKEMEGKILVKKEDKATLRGTIIVFNPEQSEIAKRLEIKEKGFYGMRFK